jgi:hypothetical protein
MFVYIINKNGQPLMPCKPQKARKLLKAGKAEVVKYEPFTIKLKFGSAGYKQPITLGIDAGSKHIGASVSTEKQELYASETVMRSDDGKATIVNLIAKRRELRRNRRNRKTRYREARFLNHVHRKHKGWLAPSVENKIHVHLKLVADIHKILPITKVVVEVAQFDIQKIKNPDISGVEYQQGEQLGWANVREYVLFRDNHECQCCKGRSGDPILNVHHIESRKTGGNAPNNLITLCEHCHQSYHQGKISLPKSIHRGMSFRDAAFMGIMRWAFYNRIKALYQDVKLTYGYITKNTRIKNNIAKTHTADAYCIAGNVKARRLKHEYLRKQVRRHNRKLHREVPAKGGIRRLAQAGHFVRGFCLNDTVMAKNQQWFIRGMRQKGSFVLRHLDGTKLEIALSKITFLRHNNSYLIERREVALTSTL